ncbi:MAG: Ca2+-dependent phosphoinositide-specific phospholipase C [Deltaproteobacteria bacterium]|nr:Ca2+-dependent phosphoinositide-specific phospholipase C [Deltaproteobacteria bacterium]
MTHHPGAHPTRRPEHPGRGLLLLLAGLAVACGGKVPQFPRDGELRLDQVQLLGTHNSYHLAPEGVTLPELAYSHAPLTTQLAQYGVRQFELDVNRIDPADPFEVFHIYTFDEETTCRRFTDCLSELKAWSDVNPLHVTLVVLLEPKDLFDAATVEDYFQQLEEEILSVWPRDRILAPADVQGSAASLAEAIGARGWPTLGEVRQKVLFVLLDGDEHREAYTHGGQDLDGRLLFASGGAGFPYGGFVLMDDPLGDPAAIPAAAEAGFLIRTRADTPGVEAPAGDTTRRDAALASGAHCISTDHPAPVEGVDYVVELPGGGVGRCNPVTAPADCTPADIEQPYHLPGD